MDYFIESSFYVKSIDISNFNTSKTISMQNMLGENYYLNEIDLSSFDTSEIEYCSRMFHDIQENCIIIISNKFRKCRNKFHIIIR